MRKFNLPITYEPKIQPVIAGTCRQTIRAVKAGSWKKEVGDLIRFYTWVGKPYHSKRTTITEYELLKEVHNVTLHNSSGIMGLANYGMPIRWNSVWADEIARRDGIVPPTGTALYEVLIAKNGKIPADGIEAQILRW